MVTARLSSEAASQVSPVPVRLPFEGAERPWSTRLPGPRRPGPGGGREAEMPASSWSAPVPGTGDRVSILGCRMGDRVAARGPGGWPLHPLLSPAPDREPEEFIPGAGAGGGDRADAEQTKAGGHVASGLWRSIPCALLPRPCFGDGYFESFQSKAVPLQALNKGPDLFFFWQHNPLRSHSPRHFSHVNIP